MFTYQPWTHTVQYYETDQMGIVHHSNYIRWFEEGRTAFLDQAGYGYDRIEAEGLISPVLQVSCSYHSPARYGEQVQILVSMHNFHGIKFSFHYEVRSMDGQTLFASGNSDHALVGRDLKPLRLSKTNPKIYAFLSQWKESNL